MITLIQRKDVFDQLCEAVDAARISAANSPAWLSRIDTAWGWLLQQESYEIRDLGTDHAAVRIPSATHAHITYEANGRCQCPAYTTRTPCWHRACSRLLRNALTLAAEAELNAREDALAAQCGCFRGALLNGDNERPACVAAGRCLDEHPAPRRCDDPAVGAQTLVDELFA